MTSQARIPAGEAAVSAAAWDHANRAMVTKILREFAHERIIEPTAAPAGSTATHELCVDDGSVYRFTAQRYQLDHIAIRPDSIARYCAGRPAPVEATALALELRARLGMAEELFPAYLEELTATVHAHADWFDASPLDAETLIQADYATIEASMVDGHPVFVANSGRIGFDADDYARFAPETGARLRAVWVAVHHSRVTRAVIDGLSREQLLRGELDADTRARFEAVLVEQNQDPAAYCFMPVHPWQWREKISRGFAADRIRGDLIYLGTAGDHYQPQQSIRTLFNVSAPHRCYIKTSLSILNMGFMRGLSPDYMGPTPSVNHWVDQLVRQDSFLCAKGFRVLREVAAIGYHKRDYDAGAGRHSPYRKMLSALWRESPVPLLEPGQRLMTMAALLHCDARGEPVVAALIRASRLSARAWIRRYLDAYLAPLLHSFFAHDLVFMPHGENLILVLDDHCPVRVFMKDVGEEVAVLNPDHALPERVAHLAVQLDEEMKINYIFLDILDCFFRFLVPLLDEYAGLPENDFWVLVAETVHGYQQRHPHLRERFRRYDLFKPAFVRTCLNRIQLNNNRQMIDLDDREKNLQLQGTLANPLAPFRDAASAVAHRHQP